MANPAGADDGGKMWVGSVSPPLGEGVGEWRVPIAFTVLWVGPFVAAIARPSWWERASVPALVFAIALTIVLNGALLTRSRAAWWILVILYVIGVVRVIQDGAGHRLGVASTLWGMLTLVNFALLVSAPMRRFVRLRVPFAPDR